MRAPLFFHSQARLIVSRAIATPHAVVRQGRNPQTCFRINTPPPRQGQPKPTSQMAQIWAAIRVLQACNPPAGDISIGKVPPHCQIRLEPDRTTAHCIWVALCGVNSKDLLT
jgi:hypothetical protein